MASSGVGRAALRDAWEHGGPLRALLTPAASVYRAGLALRRLKYRLVRAQAVGAPVVSIGNVTVGGTGKTPAALWLAERLRRDGLRPAIVTRGYGGTLERRTVTVADERGPLLSVDEIGDEATLLAERFRGPIVCGADRVAAAREAVEVHGAGVVVVDDGFQHWRLQRDFDLVLVDGRTGFGNGSLLPAGPLREPLGALRRADAIVVTKSPGVGALAPTLERHAPGVPLFAAALTARELVRSEDGELRPAPLGDLVGRRVVAVCAVAQPHSFYESLGELETRSVEVLEFPDHHRYTHDDWQRITQAAHRAELVVCTEKDLVKLRRFPFARGRLVALRVDFRLGGHEDALYESIRARVDRSPSAAGESRADMVGG
jgi:tetraacyldisaccharide 4'-kinase